jgi:hypothetical protein
MSCGCGRFPIIDFGCDSPTEAKACGICLTSLRRAAPMIEPLKSSDYFARVFVEMGAPTWPNSFDLDPINLYMQMRDAGVLTSAAAQ